MTMAVASHDGNAAQIDYRQLGHAHANLFADWHTAGNCQLLWHFQCCQKGGEFNWVNGCCLWKVVGRRFECAVPSSQIAAAKLRGACSAARSPFPTTAFPTAPILPSASTALNWAKSGPGASKQGGGRATAAKREQSKIRYSPAQSVSPDSRRRLSAACRTPDWAGFGQIGQTKT